MKVPGERRQQDTAGRFERPRCTALFIIEPQRSCRPSSASVGRGSLHWQHCEAPVCLPSRDFATSLRCRYCIPRPRFGLRVGTGTGTNTAMTACLPLC